MVVRKTPGAQGVGEYLFPLILAAAVILLGSFPYVYGYVNSCPGKIFSSFVGRGVPAQNGYFAFAKQAQEGWHLFENKLTPEEVPRWYFNPEWWLFGKAARWSGLSLVSIFHIGRVVSVFLATVSVYFLASLCLETVFQRRLVLCLVLFGGGFGWVFWGLSKTLMILLPAIWDGVPAQHAAGVRFEGLPLPVPRDLAGVTVFGYLVNNPHLIRAFAFAALTYGFLIKGERIGKRRYFVLSGACALARVMIRPYAIPEIYLVYLLTPALLSLKHHRMEPARWRNYGTAGLILFLGVIYYSYLAVSKTLGMAGWERKPAYFLDYILWCGPPFLLAFLGLAGLSRYRFMKPSTVVVTLWILLAFLIAQAYPHWRSGEEATLWPFMTAPAILVVGGLSGRLYRFLLRYTAARRFAWADISGKGFKTIGAVLFIAFCSASNVIVYYRMFSTLKHCPEPYYIEKHTYEALRWLETDTKPNQVVLASLALSPFVPRFACNKTVTGHDMITANFLEKNVSVR